MSTAKKNGTFFDDDFEVTYEEDVPFTYSFDTKQTTKKLSDATVVLDAPDYRSMPGNSPEHFSQNTGRVPKNRYDNRYDSRDSGFTDEYDSENFDVEYFGSDDTRTRMITWTPVMTGAPAMITEHVPADVPGIITWRMIMTDVPAVNI